LSELDFVVKQKPGTKICHADTLSQHVGTVTLANTLDKEIIRRDQDKDDFCIESNPGTISRKCEYFPENKGVIYKRHPLGKHQIVVPRTLVQTVVKENYD